MRTLTTGRRGKALAFCEEIPMIRLSDKLRIYPERAFGGFSDIDGTVLFYTRIRALLTTSSIVLDVGCGRGEYADDAVAFRRKHRILRGSCAKVIGLDVDLAASSNPFIDVFHLLNGSVWPIGNETIDVCVMDWVVEHLPDPLAAFKEMHRVLKPGGAACLRTTNRLSIPGIGATLIPNRLHAKALQFLQERRKEEDVFPTLHRCNTVSSLRKTLDAAGLESVAYGYESEPAYFAFSAAAFAAMGRLRGFIPSRFRTTLFGFARKPAPTTTAVSKHVSRFCSTNETDFKSAAEEAAGRL